MSGRPMPPRRSEWRVRFRGQTTSKPSIHGAPSYGLRNFSGSPKKNVWWMKNQCLQYEGLTIHMLVLEHLCEILKVPRGSQSSHGVARRAFTALQWRGWAAYESQFHSSTALIFKSWFVSWWISQADCTLSLTWHSSRLVRQSRTSRIISWSCG